MEDEVKQIMLDKLKEMSEIKFEDCANNEYPEICKAMNEIADTLIKSEYLLGQDGKTSYFYTYF